MAQSSLSSSTNGGPRIGSAEIPATAIPEQDDVFTELPSSSKTYDTSNGTGENTFDLAR